jgi:hypothetical protein
MLFIWSVLKVRQNQHLNLKNEPKNEKDAFFTSKTDKIKRKINLNFTHH